VLQVGMEQPPPLLVYMLLQVLRVGQPRHSECPRRHQRWAPVQRRHLRPLSQPQPRRLRQSPTHESIHTTHVCREGEGRLRFCIQSQ
jgi:hypothetical protein